MRSDQWPTTSQRTVRRRSAKPWLRHCLRRLSSRPLQRRRHRRRRMTPWLQRVPQPRRRRIRHHRHAPQQAQACRQRLHPTAQCDAACHTWQQLRPFRQSPRRQAPQRRQECDPIPQYVALNHRVPLQARCGSFSSDDASAGQECTVPESHPDQTP